MCIRERSRPVTNIWKFWMPLWPTTGTVRQIPCSAIWLSLIHIFRFDKEILKRRGYKFQSDCDCEILLPLYYEYGLDMFRHMDSCLLYTSRCV